MRAITWLSLLVAIAVFSTGCAKSDSMNSNGTLHEAGLRKEIDFNFDWQFALAKDSGDEISSIKESTWRTIRLPHDWSIEFDYTKENAAGATGYLPGGVGWYRKTFPSPLLPDGTIARTHILFDGIYNHSTISINGQVLGYRPNGYVPIVHDLTPHLSKDGSENEILVFVDRSRYVDSRWYTGSGIYRNVRLFITGDIHVPIWGVTVTTPTVTPENAIVEVAVDLENHGEVEQELEIVSSIIDDAGNMVAEEAKALQLTSQLEGFISHTFALDNPRLWDVEDPNLYTAIVKIYANGTLLDETHDRFGIRSIHFDPDTGFYLNGRNLKIKGVNLHHDGGLVGSAVPRGVWERRLSALKSAGVNAIRTAHNPASSEFLDICDEMGFLVQEEAFDEWNNAKNKRHNFYHRGEIKPEEEGYSAYFDEWAERDLIAMLARDKNHPSIFQWSIGNEIEWSYPRYPASTGYWDENRKPVASMWDKPPITPEESRARFAKIDPVSVELADTAKNLAQLVRKVDTTRPIIANMVNPSVSHHSGFADVLDVAGYSYRQPIYDYARRYYPTVPIMGTENFAQWHEWKAVIDRPFVAGLFLWTGIDYLGEAEMQWPRKGSPVGLLDLAGFTKPSYHMMKSLWSDEPHIFVTTRELKNSIYVMQDGVVLEKEPGQWQKRTWAWHRVSEHWNYEPGETIVVEVYTCSFSND